MIEARVAQSVAQAAKISKLTMSTTTSIVKLQGTRKMSYFNKKILQ